MSAEEVAEHRRWRYQSGVQRLCWAWVEVTADEQAGAEVYVSPRSRWDPLIRRLAPVMAYHMDQIDPAVGHPPGVLAPQYSR